MVEPKIVSELGKDLFTIEVSVLKKANLTFEEVKKLINAQKIKSTPPEVTHFMHFT